MSNDIYVSTISDQYINVNKFKGQKAVRRLDANAILIIKKTKRSNAFPTVTHDDLSDFPTFTKFSYESPCKKKME